MSVNTSIKGNSHQNQSFSQPINHTQLDSKTIEQFKKEYETKRHCLCKKDKFFGNLATRWFQILGNELIYYSSQDKKKPSKTISLTDIEIRESSPKLKGYPFCIELHKSEKSIYWLHQSNEQEKIFLTNYIRALQPKNFIDVNNMASKNSSIVSVSKSSASYVHILNSGSLNLSKKLESEKSQSMKEDLLMSKGIYNTLNQKVSPRIVKETEDTSSRKAKVHSTELSDEDIGADDHIFSYPHFRERYSLTNKVDNFFKKHPNSRQSETTQNTTHYETHPTTKFLKTKFQFEKTDVQIATYGIENSPCATDQGDEEVPSEYECIPANVKSMDFKTYKDGFLNISFSRSLNASPTFEKGSLQVPHTRLRSSVIGPHIHSEIQSPLSKRYNDDILAESFIVLSDIRIPELREKRRTVALLSSAKPERDRENSKENSDGVGTPKSTRIRDDDNFYDELKKIKSIDECIFQGHYYMWTYQIEKAKKCFLLYKYEDKLLELLRVECNLMEIAISGSEKRIKDVLNELTNLYTKVCEYEINQKDDLNKYVSNELNKAEILIYKCGMNLFLGNKFQTLKNLAEGWRCYKKLEAIFEKKKDIISSRNSHRFKFGHGCFNLAFSLIPPGILRFIKLIGINPDKELGLKSLEECRQDNDIRSNYCVIILALYTIEFEVVSDKACDYLQEAIQKWSKCPFFYWIGSIICWKYCQAKDAYFMIKSSMWILKQTSKTAVFLLYELGWYHFLNMNWKPALDIFKKIATFAFPRKFFTTQMAEVQSSLSSMKVSIPFNPTKCHEDLISPEEDKSCILPHLPQLAIKIAACYYKLGQADLGTKWLLSAPVIHKKYSNFKSKPEEDFARLSMKFLGRESKHMLVYEIFYYMRYMPKLPDEILRPIIEEVEGYKNQLGINSQQLKYYLSKANKNENVIIEYFSSTLILLVNNCLLGETETACKIFDEIKPFMGLIPEEYGYMVPHIEYWVGRALVAEDKEKEARQVLKNALKRKKCEFNIANKIKKVMTGLD